MDQKGHSLGFERFSKLMNESIHLKDLKRAQFGEDALIRGYLRK
jgi:hypothetical protein